MRQTARRPFLGQVVIGGPSRRCNDAIMAQCLTRRFEPRIIVADNELVKTLMPPKQPLRNHLAWCLQTPSSSSVRRKNFCFHQNPVSFLRLCQSNCGFKQQNAGRMKKYAVILHFSLAKTLNYYILRYDECNKKEGDTEVQERIIFLRLFCGDEPEREDAVFLEARRAFFANPETDQGRVLRKEQEENGVSSRIQYRFSGKKPLWIVREGRRTAQKLVCRKDGSYAVLTFDERGTMVREEMYSAGQLACVTEYRDASSRHHRRARRYCGAAGNFENRRANLRLCVPGGGLENKEGAAGAQGVRIAQRCLTQTEHLLL